MKCGRFTVMPRSEPCAIVGLFASRTKYPAHHVRHAGSKDPAYTAGKRLETV